MGEGGAHRRPVVNAPRARAGPGPVPTVLGVRHGAVEHPPGSYYGHLPHVGLSARGRAQAEAAARELIAHPVRVIYASPLDRARQTAEIVAAATGAEVRVDGRLREWKFWEAIHQDRAGAPLPSAVRAARSTLLGNPDDDRCGESLAQLQGRLVSWLDEVKETHGDGIVIGVSHFDALRCLLAALLPDQRELAWAAKIEHCQVLRLHPHAAMDPFGAEPAAGGP